MSDKIEQIFNLLEKVYIDVQEVKERVSRVEQSQVRTEERVSSIEERVSNVEQSQVRMENKFDEKLKALFDAYSLNNERISNLVNLPDRVSYLETDVRILKKIVLNQKNY